MVAWVTKSVGDWKLTVERSLIFELSVLAFRNGLFARRSAAWEDEKHRQKQWERELAGKVRGE